MGAGLPSKEMMVATHTHFRTSSDPRGSNRAKQ
jgi:hypothetical protein